MISWAPNQRIRMISEGSCDTEDKFGFTIAWIKYILKCIEMENWYFKLQLLFTIVLFLLYFRLNKSSFREHMRHSKTLKNLTNHKLLNSFLCQLYIILYYQINSDIYSNCLVDQPSKRHSWGSGSDCVWWGRRQSPRFLGEGGPSFNLSKCRTLASFT